MGEIIDCWQYPWLFKTWVLEICPTCCKHTYVKMQDIVKYPYFSECLNYSFMKTARYTLQNLNGNFLNKNSKCYIVCIYRQRNGSDLHVTRIPYSWYISYIIQYHISYNLINKIILTVLYAVHGAGLGVCHYTGAVWTGWQNNSLLGFTTVRGCVERFYLPRVTSFLSVLLATACVSICFITIVYARRVSPTRVISDTRNSWAGPG